MKGLNFQTTTGVYIGARYVYVAQLKGGLFGARLLKFGQAEIEVASSADKAQADEAKIGAIKKVFRENKINAKKVFTALSGKDVLIRYFQMPKIPKAEWETAIKFEAKRHIPFKIEELFWDFQANLSRGKDAKMDITFVAVKKEIAENHISLLEQAGFKILALEPAPFSLVRLFTSGKQLAKNKPSIIVDIDYGMADINILKEKICYLTRDVSLPLEEEVIFDNLLNELRMSLDYYEKLFPVEIVGKILLCGQVDLKDWDKALSQELKIPVEKADLAKAIKVRRSLPPLSMAVAIGLGLRKLVLAPNEVNLYRVRKVKAEVAPPASKEQVFKFTPELRYTAYRAIKVSCVGLLILYLLMFYRISEQKKELEQIIALRPKVAMDAKGLSYEDIEKARKELQDKVSSLDLLITDRVFWTNKFNELPRIIPPGAWLTDLSFNDRVSKNKVNRSLTIKGIVHHEDHAQEVRVITNFVSSLKENQNFFEGFEEIELESMDSIEVQGTPVKNFTIICIKK